MIENICLLWGLDIMAVVNGVDGVGEIVDNQHDNLDLPDVDPAVAQDFADQMDEVDDGLDPEKVEEMITKLAMDNFVLLNQKLMERLKEELNSY